MSKLETMLEIRHVTKVLGDRVILKNITFTLAKGEILAIIGPNGAGKSTLFKCIAGLLKPTEGDMILNGINVKKNSRELKKKIGFLGHESFLYTPLTPMENLKFYGRLYKVKDLDRKADDLLKEVGLYFFKDTPIRSFSRGMIQRLAIARVLLPDPDILLLDEPHTGLDQDAVSLIDQILHEKKEAGRSILFISHDYEQVQSLADRAAILKQGRIADTIQLDTNTEFNRIKQWYEKVVSKG